MRRMYILTLHAKLYDHCGSQYVIIYYMFTNKVSGEECINLEKKWNGSVKADTAVRACILACLRACARTLVSRRRWREVGKVSGDSEEVNAKRIFFLNLILGLSAKIIKEYVI